MTTPPPGAQWPGSALEELRLAAQKDDSERCLELLRELLGNFRTGVDVPVDISAALKEVQAVTE